MAKQPDGSWAPNPDPKVCEPFANKSVPAEENDRGFPKIWGTFLGLPIIRIREGEMNKPVLIVLTFGTAVIQLI